MIASSGSHSREIARRYASALFTLARERECLTGVTADLEKLATYIDGHYALRDVLKSAAIARAIKARVLVAIAKQSDFSDLVQSFVGMTARNGRAMYLPTMIDCFKDLLEKEQGVLHVCVRTARHMTEEQKKRLRDVLAPRFGRKMHMSAEIDPALGGGICLRIGSYLIDASLAAKLANLNNAMKGA